MKDYLLIGMLVLLSGISWAQCATGTPGTNCTGPLNVQPQAGNTGQSAITFVDLGLPAPAPGGGQYTLSIASGILQESDNGNSYHSLVGPFGPQGPQGATGPVGPQGAQGAQGPSGATGPSGPIGATGVAGAVGAQGLIGLTGPAGPAGATGTAGPAGAQGLIGLTGPAGPAGATGAVGPAGAQGLIGLTGPAGPAGATGAVGPAGVQGLTGPIGPSGPIGATGAPGAVGAQGLIGLAGPAGLAGASGTPGAVGAQGTIGAAGPAGPQGPPGTLAAPPDYSFYYGENGFRAVVGSNEVGGTIDRDQIDMLSATSVRFVITMASSVLPSGSYAEAEYTPDGTNWYPLSGEVPVTSPNGTYTSGWQGMPTGANGDYLVRTIVFNAGTTTAQVGVRQLHLQFK